MTVFSFGLLFRSKTRTHVCTHRPTKKERETPTFTYARPAATRSPEYRSIGPSKTRKLPPPPSPLFSSSLKRLPLDTSRQAYRRGKIDTRSSLSVAYFSSFFSRDVARMYYRRKAIYRNPFS